MITLPHASFPRQSGTVHGFSGEVNEGFVPHVRRRSLIGRGKFRQKTQLQYG